jgi:soluble P-type ATPase
MLENQAVVFDVAGTILMMYRVAKNVCSGNLIEKVITSDLILEKAGRALIVTQMDPINTDSFPPDMLLNSILEMDCIEISCCSTPVLIEDVKTIINNSNVLISDFREVYRAVTIKCPSGYRTAGMIVDVDTKSIPYIISTAGRPFPGLSEVILKLEEIGVDVYIASGDSMRSLLYLEDLGFSLDHIYPVSSPARKRDIVVGLKQHYQKVVMVGDGLNDLQALKASDLGVLTIQQDSHPSPLLFQAADEVINDIRCLPKLLMV